MTTRLLLLAILMPFLLTGCGLKDRVFKPDSSVEDDALPKKELTGMLLVLDPERCPLVAGCGPQFSLLGRNLKSQVAVQGPILPEHNNLIVTVIGKPSRLPDDLRGKSGYERISAILSIKKYRLRSTIPYYPFLVEQATVHTTEEFGCDLLWDKSYSWNIEDNVPSLSVRMTNTFAPQPQPWVELSFNGDSGELTGVKTDPTQLNPCQ